MILHLDDNMLMWIELLPSLMMILFIFFIQRCVWDVKGVKPVYAVCCYCIMYAAMYAE